MTANMTHNDVFQIVKSNILEVLPHVAPESIQIDRRLTDLGANSIDRVEIVTLCMASLKLNIPLLSFAKVSNIESLVGVLHSSVKP